MSQSHRLSGIYLINARTSGMSTSNRIGCIDPRGAASLVGDNAAGKTTTLMILPYFFGAAPGWSSSGGKVHPIEFLLPQPDCAIAFEYERGSSGKHLVVLRADGHSPRYRILKTAFRRDLFLGESEGKKVFLKDDDLRRICTDQGIERTDEMGIHQYQTVILGAKHGEVHDKRYVRLGYEYSYAGDSLPNLNLLMAGVIKKGLRFKDLQHVIADLIAQRLGGASPTLKMADMRDITNRLLSDYESVQRVLDNRVNEAQLYELMQASRASDQTLNLTIRRLEATRALWGEKLETAKKAQAEAERHVAAAAEKAESESMGLNAQINALVPVKAERKSAFDVLEDEAARFTTQDAAGKSARMQKLPELIAARSSAKVALELLQAGYQAVISEFDGRMLAAADRHSAELGDLNQQRSADMSSRALELDAAGALSKTKLSAIEAERESAIGLATEGLNAAKIEVGIAQDGAKRPAIPEEMTANLEAAERNATSAASAYDKVKIALDKARDESARLRAEFERADRQFEVARDAKDRADRALEDARESLKPPQGSLQAYVLSLPDSVAHSRLVRLVSPTLLARTDLSPSVADGWSDDSGTAFGLSVDLSSVELPAWADPKALQALLAKAEEAVEKAKGALTAAEEARGRADFARAAATDAQVQKAFDASAAERQKNEASSILAGLRAERDEVRRNLIASAEQRLTELKKNQDAAERHLRETTATWSASIARCKAETDAELEKIRSRYESDTQFGERRRALESRQRADREQIQRLKDLALEEKGADPKLIFAAQVALNEAVGAVETVESFSGLVESWKRWLENSGPEKLEQARASLQSVSEQMSALVSKRAQVISENEETLSNLRKLKSDADSRLSVVDGEIGRLEALVISHPLKPLDGIEGPAESLPFASVEDANGACQKAEQDRRRAEANLTSNIAKFRGAFVPNGLPGQVQDLLEPKIAELGDAPRPIDLARVYLEAQKSVVANLVPNICNTYGTVRSKLSNARERLSDFRKQVSAFDKQLQQGMVKVTQFDSIQNLELHVTTDSGSIPWLHALDQALGDDYEEVMEQVKKLPPLARVQAIHRYSQSISPGSHSIDLADILTLSGSVEIHHVVKHFKRDEDLASLDSNGMTIITQTALVIAMINCIRRDNPVWIPYVLDEVSNYDNKNFASLLKMLNDNHIDVMTATPKLSGQEMKLFTNRYNLKRGGIIGVYVDRPAEALA